MSHTVDLEALENVMIRMQGLGEYVAERLSELDRRITVLHTTWSGEAAQEQRAAHDRWSRGAGEMQQALADLRSVAGTALSNYGQASAANCRMWG